MSVPDFSNCSDEDVNEAGLILEGLKNTNPFSEIPPKVLEIIAQTAQYRECNVEETVFASGQNDGSSIFVIIKGTLKSASLNEKTGEMHLVEASSGYSFGLPAAVSNFAGDDYNQLTLTAGREGAMLIVLEAENFREIVLQRPTLSRILMQYFADLIVRQEASPTESGDCLLYTSPSPRDLSTSRMPSSA